MGGISTPLCASSEGGFLQGIVCALKHCVPSKVALFIGSSAANQDGDPDSVPLALGEGNGDWGSFVHRSGCGAGSCPACAYPIRSVGGSLPPWWTVLRPSQWRQPYACWHHVQGMLSQTHGRIVDTNRRWRRLPYLGAMLQGR